jgi:hypothetical protein
MKRRPETTADCDTCVGNRQLLNQLLADVAALSDKVTNSPALTLEGLRIEVAHLGPDDYLVFTADRPLADVEVANIVERTRQTFPGRKVIVLDGGLNVAVIHPVGGNHDVDT